MRDRPTITGIADRLLRPESPGFLPELWRSFERREQDAARRWRRIAIALAAALLAAVAAAGVIASPFGSSSTVEVSVECLTQTMGSRHTVDVATVATRSASGAAQNGRPREAQLLVSTGGTADQGTRLLQLDAVLKGYLVNGSRCAKSHDTAAPRKTGLRLTDYLRSGAALGHVYRCYEARIRLSMHLTVGKSGMPTRAVVAIERPATKKPLVYVDWRPGAVQVYRSDACQTTDVGF